MPDLNSFVVILAILLVPGYLGARVFRSLGRWTREPGMKSWDDFLQILTFSLIGHSPGFIFSRWFDWWKEPTLLSLSENALQAPHWLFDLVAPLLVASFLGSIAAYAANHKLAYKWICKPLKIKRYGDEDVWTYLMNGDGFEWVHVRDHRYGFAYNGWIQLYSDSGESRELMLNDVDVRNNDTGDFLYHVPRLYISRDQHELSIENFNSEDKVTQCRTTK